MREPYDSKKHGSLYVQKSPPEYTTDHQSPKHYSRWKIEPIVFIRANNLDALRANIIKYIMRFDAKEGRKDLEKAQQYLAWLIEDWDNDRAREEQAILLAGGAGVQPDLFTPEVLPPRRQLEGCSGGTIQYPTTSYQAYLKPQADDPNYYDSTPSSCEPTDDQART